MIDEDNTTFNQANQSVSDLLTVTEVASFIRVHPETVRRYIREGHIKAIKLTGKRSDYRISKKSLEAFMGGRQ